MKFTREQYQERVENLGGFIVDDNYAVFRYNENVSNDEGESISLQEALNDEGQMMDLGFDGALIGHPYDESDIKCIYFKF